MHLSYIEAPPSLLLKLLCACPTTEDNHPLNGLIFSVENPLGPIPGMGDKLTRRESICRLIAEAFRRCHFVPWLLSGLFTGALFADGL